MVLSVLSYCTVLDMRTCRCARWCGRRWRAPSGGTDALLSAVAPSAAYKFGEKLDDPLAMYKGDLMTVGLNLSGRVSGF